MKYLIILLLGILAFCSHAESQLQSDSSDAVWSIVVPKVASRDIDMGKVLLNSYKDSVISSFIVNTGSWECKIKDIKVSGTNSSDYYVISNRSFTMIPGEIKAIEFHFKPGALGKRDAKIEIVTQVDTLSQNITGEGIQPQLDVSSRLIDFGIIEAGDIKDTLIFLLKNLSSSQIDISDTKLLGPDLTQFEIISGGGTFSLNGGESREMKLRFRPVAIGRTSCELGFYYSGTGSPVRAQLYGQGIGGNVYLSSDSARPGDKKIININLGGVKAASMKKVASKFKAVIKFQKTVIASSNNTLFKNNNSDSTFLEISGPIGSDSVLYPIEFVAGLGITDYTSIDFESFKWYDENGDEIEYESELSSGEFKILGICRDGGKRLINPEAQAAKMTLSPNPAGDKIDISLTVNESGLTDICIYNVLGQKIKQVFLENIQNSIRKEISTDISELNQGQYILILKTATYTENIKLSVIK